MVTNSFALKNSKSHGSSNYTLEVRQKLVGLHVPGRMRHFDPILVSSLHGPGVHLASRVDEHDSYLRRSIFCCDKIGQKSRIYPQIMVVC